MFAKIQQRNIVKTDDAPLLYGSFLILSVSNISTLKSVPLKSVPVNYSVVSVRFSEDSQLMATASSYHTVKLWPADGILKTKLRGTQGRVSALSISRDKKLLATVGEDKRLLLWKLDIRGDLDKLLARRCSWLGEYLESTEHDTEGEDAASDEESVTTTSATLETLDSNVIHSYCKDDTLKANNI
ncbi:MAG: WD40 repeat domain-containing protein [Phormidesmis sp.]